MILLHFSHSLVAELKIDHLIIFDIVFDNKRIKYLIVLTDLIFNFQNSIIKIYIYYTRFIIKMKDPNGYLYKNLNTCMVSILIYFK